MHACGQIKVNVTPLGLSSLQQRFLGLGRLSNLQRNVHSLQWVKLWMCKEGYVKKDGRRNS